ncbi:transglycosylase family protein [Streptomyces sp. TP-A0356]|uniref:LysM peptidoglycan-binding domain-containing protein n=1 Tax=Streptomyces sp. TP-A0356 TaxID=1359208 RepID=UPI0006E2211A|nr:transglycosylase family protein [Streptomyces sp. TP-A0356]
MLSGNGRHRRPRQAPALLVAAGVTGSAIAIPLLGATGASAASGTTWDQVAECESGGSWSADTGNGRYGGLQLSQEDWGKHGGLDYAPSPDQASRSQQIAVAEKVLADRGVSAWPTCGLVAGLNKDSGSAGVDTGLAGESAGSGSASGSGIDLGLSESSLSSGSSASVNSSPSSSLSSSPSSSPSPSSSSSPSPSSSPASGSPETAVDPARSGAGTSAPGASGASATATTKGSESDKSGQNATSSGAGASEASSAGRHRGGSAYEGATDGRTGDSAGRHASRGSADARATADSSYTVRPGDSLSVIADSLSLTGGWTALYDANKATVGADPNLILPGQSLALDVGPTGTKP